MNRRKWIGRMAAILSVTVLVTAMAAQVLTGCSKNSEKDEKKQAKGRYVESEIALPEGAGRPVGILWKDENMVLYTYQEEEESFQSYTWEKSAWSAPREASWMTDGLGRLGQLANDMRLGRDGKVYAITQTVEENQPYGPHLLTDAGDGTALDVTPEELLKTAGEGYTVGFVDAVVLKDGTIGVCNSRSGMIEFYKDNKNVFSTESDSPGAEFQNMLTAADDTVAVLSEDGTGICFYSTGTFEKKHTIEIGENLGTAEDIQIVAGKDGIWYVVTKNGIQRIAEDGSIVETVMDGSNGLMSSTSAWMRTMLAGEENVFYGLYASSQEFRLMCYAFDKDVPAVQEQTLSIYSLMENRTVTQAVYEFQNVHPEVKVEYQFAAGESEAPTSDAIRTLNAELLSGNGADVLILDGLPLESYMKKGVLADLSELTEKLSKEGVLMDVIGNTAQMDGKTYALPARIRIPVVYGTEAEVKACKNMETLHTYAEENTDNRLFGRSSHDLIGMTLFHMLYDEIAADGEGLDEEKLTQLVMDWMKICENGGLRSYEEAAGTVQGESVWNDLNKNFCSSQEVFGESVYANVNEVDGLHSAGEVYLQTGKTGSAPESLKGYYTPVTIAGVNAASGQSEMAVEFITCLFSEKVQENDTWDGFPVLEKALENMVEYVDTPEAKERSIGFSFTDPETGEEILETISYPDKEEMESFVELIKGLRTPFISDRIVTDTVLEELEKCYAGTQTPEETAKNICQKVDTYLAE